MFNSVQHFVQHWLIVHVLGWPPAAAEACESGQPAGGLQTEKTAPLGARVLWADGPQRAGQTPERVGQVETAARPAKWTGDDHEHELFWIRAASYWDRWRKSFIC